ncbi:ATP-binding protein [Paenibacillus montanisoli]|uniref:histidine kinase n=1 Tax=Paenibacillus montanisoli TaxID=2081970 RepID=A0A328U0K7_9BACL|nr:sensor histidine kinase [Paenibacillus montanisoli]RAP76318.1 histidine kinase [Paenibacillus montanisoli]
MLRRLRINWKITILSLGILLFALCIGGVVLTGHIADLQEKELGRRLMVTARTVAELPPVTEGLVDPSSTEKAVRMKNTAERVRIVNDVDYIVVMDMNGIRRTHPTDAVVGTISRGTDEKSSFAEHTYLSRAKGEKGTALRAFVPVMNENREQVGVVLVGKLLPKLSAVIRDMSGEIYVIAFLTLLFGTWGSWLLAGHIKKQMFELEPDEIAQLVVERTATFQAMHEGIIAIDKTKRITIFNDMAKTMLRVNGDMIGKPIEEVLPDTRLPEIIELNRPVYNQDLFIGPAHIVTNRIPITVGGQVVGAVATFRDRTEVTRMAEELTGVQSFVEALRVQSHEYMNKLHTIGGLLQLDDKKRAMDYLFEITEQQEEQSRFVNQRIRSDSLKGLFMGKISRGKELGIRLRLDEMSWLERLPASLDNHDMVIVLGNLIENAFDALQRTEGDKEVFISIEQDEDVLSILVEDNGCGMDEETKRRLFERGYSTKEGESRGIGMYLIDEIVRKAGGVMRIETAEGQGTAMMLTLPMQRQGGDGDGENIDAGH